MEIPQPDQPGEFHPADLDGVVHDQQARILTGQERFAGFEIAPGIEFPAYYKSDTQSLGGTMRDKKIVEGLATAIKPSLDSMQSSPPPEILSLHPPSMGEKILPEVSEEKLRLFDPKPRRPRKPDGIGHTIVALSQVKTEQPDEQRSFLGELLPEGLDVVGTMVLIDTNPDFRDIIARASYRILDKMYKDGDLDDYPRVKNNGQKSVNHGDSLIDRGSSRDVVVAMVLDSLSGRFDWDEKQRDSRAMGDGTRGSDGTFNGGQHSGAAGGVLRELMEPKSYQEYFGEPIYTKEENLFREIWRLDGQEGETVVDPTLLRDPPEQTEFIRKATEVPLQPLETQSFALKGIRGVDSLMIKPSGSQRNYSLSFEGEESRIAVVIRDVQAIAGIRHTVEAAARKHGVTDKEFINGAIKDAVIKGGFERYIPIENGVSFNVASIAVGITGEEITVSNNDNDATKDAATLYLKGPGYTKGPGRAGTLPQPPEGLITGVPSDQELAERRVTTVLNPVEATRTTPETRRQRLTQNARSLGRRVLNTTLRRKK